MSSRTEAKLHRKGFNDISAEEVDALLGDPHVAVFSVSRKNKSPFSVPVWYEYRPDEGNVYFGIDPPGVKGKLLEKAGCATITVQTEEEPYKYVMVEGEARYLSEDELKARDETVASMMHRIFLRYLTPDLAKRYAATLPILAPKYAMVRLTPDRILGESLRVHATWMPRIEDLPAIQKAVESGVPWRDALEAVAGGD